MNINFILVLVLALLSILATSITCGGNCPDSSCQYCPCGSKKSYISVDKYCLQTSVWDQSCCICIATRLNGGNTNFAEKKGRYYYIGVMEIQGVNSQDQKNMCDPAKNVRDAVYVYQNIGWNAYLWNHQAKACGCLNMTADVVGQQEVSQILMQKS